MKKLAFALVLLLAATLASAQIILTVDTNVVVPVNKVPVVLKADGVTTDADIAYNEGGMALRWNFVTKAGAVTSTAVTPTTGGNYDWAATGGGMYSIEIIATGGVSANNDTEGFGWFSGETTADAQWAGPIVFFAKANVVNSLVDSSDLLDISVVQIAGSAVNTAAAQLGVNAVQVAGATPDTKADIAAVILTTPANLLATDASGQVTVGTIANNAVTAAAVANAAIDAATFAAGAIDAAAIAANAIGASELAADAATEVATAVGAHTIGDSTLTVDQAMQIMIAFMAGKATGGGTTTLTFRNYADSLNRLVLTVDADGNRSATVFTANP
jgi:hypothetical protein